MVTSYVGIISRHGLELYYREGVHTARFLLRRPRRFQQSQAWCVWFVMDDQFETVLDVLLTADDPDAAWTWVQDSAREFGTLLPEWDLSCQCGDSG